MADAITRVSVAEATKALTDLAAEFRGETFAKAKAQYLKSVTIVDDSGSEIAAEDIDIVVMDQDETESVEKSVSNDDILDTVRKTIRDEVAKVKAASKTRLIIGDVKPAGIDFVPYGKPKNFKGENAALKAYRFGAFFAAAAGRDWAAKRCKSLGIRLEKGHVEGNNTLGGFLVPDEFGMDMIDLRDEFGVARVAFRREVMSSDTKTQPRRKNGLTAYFTGEGAPITESTMGWDRVTLTARKLAVLTRASNELNEDALVSIGDTVAGEIAYAFANKEDECGFNGDGTSQYGGIIGAIPKILIAAGSLPTVGTFVGGLYKANTTTWSGVTIAMITEFMSRLPSYAKRGAAWYCHPAFASAVLGRLSITLGGSAVTDFAGSMTRTAFGYPIVDVEVMRDTPGTNAIQCIFGNLGLAGMFGDRRGTTIAVTTEGADAFEQDEIVIRGTERFDINVHDAGSATSAGPYIAFTTGT